MMKYLLILSLLLSFSFAQDKPKEETKAQEQPTPKKKSVTFGNEDLGVPEKSSSDRTRLDDSRESFEDRKAILKIDEKDPKVYQEKLVNLFFEKQSQGKPTGYFFCNPILASSLFAVRSWTIVDKLNEETISIFTLRVDSSNKGGQPITALWSVTVLPSQYKDYCVSSFREKQK